MFWKRERYTFHNLLILSISQPIKMKSIDQLLETGKELQTQRNWGESIDIFTEAITQAQSTSHPRFAEAHNDRGFSYVMSGHPEEAYQDNQ
jgi:hypothetical protein